MSANLGTDDHRFVVPARERPRDRTRRRAEGLLAAISLRSRPSEHQSAIVRRPADDRPPDGAVLAFLRAHHGVDVLDLVALGGGFWSASYAYGVGSDELVLRLADTPDGFRADESAQAYGSASMPVPEVLAIGQGLDRWFAISRRHHGRFLEDVSPDEADAVAPAVIGLLRDLSAVRSTRGTPPPWRAWLLDGITDRPGLPTSGWRSAVADRPRADRAFREADARIRSLLDACPNDRRLVHGDLLHGNVLMSPAGDAVTAVFSWKCATWGDPLYDLAWCTFWGRWHDGIGAMDLWGRVVPSLTGSEAVDIAQRHHVYEVQIAASHLGWYATLGDEDNLTWTVRQIGDLLEQGPRR